MNRPSEYWVVRVAGVNLRFAKEDLRAELLDTRRGWKSFDIMEMRDISGSVCRFPLNCVELLFWSTVENRALEDEVIAAETPPKPEWGYE